MLFLVEVVLTSGSDKCLQISFVMQIIFPTSTNTLLSLGKDTKQKCFCEF